MRLLNADLPEGNTIIFKAWDSSEDQEYTLTEEEVQFYDLNTQPPEPIDPVPYEGLGNALVTINGGMTSYLTVDPPNRDVGPAAGQTVAFTVTSNISWSVSESETWLSVTPASGSGDGTLTVNYDENTSTSERVGTISVSGGGITREVTVTQAGAQPFITVIPESYFVEYESGDTTLIIQSNTEWNVLVDESWVTITPTTGSGYDTLSVHFEQNSDLDPRTAIIKISGGGISVDVEFNQDYMTDIATNMNEPPKEYRLEQNYPNPFNPTTTIPFSLPRSVYVNLKIFNILGIEVAELVSGDLPAGNHQIVWDTKGLAGGIYYYRLLAGDFQDIKKMILLK